MTESEYWSFLRGKLRSAHTRWKPAQDALERAKRPCKKGRQKVEYQCAKCLEWFPRTQVDKDHIIPCGSLLKYDHLVPFVQRMFVSVDDYRILCKKCHLGVTNEAKQRRKSEEVEGEAPRETPRKSTKVARKKQGVQQ